MTLYHKHPAPTVHAPARRPAKQPPIYDPEDGFPPAFCAQAAEARALANQRAPGAPYDLKVRAAVCDLYYDKGLSYRRIAALIGIDGATVSRMLERARQKIPYADWAAMPVHFRGFDYSLPPERALALARLEATLARRDARLSAEATLRRTPTAMLCGDPLPGRSALDARLAQAPPLGPTLKRI